MATLKQSLKVLLDENGQNPLTMSDKQILEQIYTSHVHNHNDIKFDVDSLFTLAENILKRSTHVVDNVVQGTRVSPEEIEDKFPANFFTPLCTLKQISSEMSCKRPGEEIAHKTTLSILNKLSTYSWHAKAVISLAAFAMECGDFWLLSQLQPTDPLAKSVAILKGVPLLTKPAAVEKQRKAIVELNSLIKATLQVVDFIYELEKLTSYDIKEVPALALAIQQIPVDVYWSIITIVAIVTQTDCLLTNSEIKQELSHFGQKINIILSKLRMQFTLCKKQIEEVEYYKKLKIMFQTPIEIIEIFKMLIFWKDTAQPLYDGATKTMTNIEVLKKKNVFLFISTLDITEEEISILRPIYDTTKTRDQYKILWIPIVDEWNDQLRKNFDALKTKMPWYVVQYFTIIAGLKYIKEEWQFKKKPMVVVMNPQGMVSHSNAFHMIQVWGLNGFPFTSDDEHRLTREASWIGPLVTNISPGISTWFKEEKYILFYGGKDKDWIQQFSKYVTTLANDVTIKEAKILIELFCLEKEDRSIISRFWSGIESLFVTKMHMTTDTVTQEVQKMLSYKNESGWALLTKGSTVLVAGHGATFLKTLEEFGKWKELVIKKGFDISLKEHHEKVVRTFHRCSHLEIHNLAGKIPETIKCPECHRTMEVFINYKCCHNGGVFNSTN